MKEDWEEPTYEEKALVLKKSDEGRKDIKRKNEKGEDSRKGQE